MAETGFGSHPKQKRSRPPSSTMLDAHSTVSAVALITSIDLGIGTRDTRGFSSNMSTQLRRVQT